jgi:hypothetical protein
MSLPLASLWLYGWWASITDTEDSYAWTVNGSSEEVDEKVTAKPTRDDY